MRDRKYKILLGILIILLIAIIYIPLDNFLSNKLGNDKTIQVGRVIDGDTVVDTNNLHYRLLGIYNKTV